MNSTTRTPRSCYPAQAHKTDNRRLRGTTRRDAIAEALAELDEERSAA